MMTLKGGAAAHTEDTLYLLRKSKNPVKNGGWRTKSRQKRVRNREKLYDFGLALKLLHTGERETRAILRGLLDRGDEADRHLIDDLMAFATHGCVTHGIRAERPIRTAEHATARKMLVFVIRQFSRLRRHKPVNPNGRPAIRVTGKKHAWWGRQHWKRELSQFEIDQIKIDRELAIEASGGDPKQAKRTRSKQRTYCRKESQGGLAAQNERCAQTIGRWARLARVFDLLKCTQPKASAEDAIVPQGGEYAYPQWDLTRPPPRGLMRQLQQLWGEKVREPAKVERKPAQAPRVNAPKVTEPARGPPPPRAPATESGLLLRAAYLARLGNLQPA